MKPKGSVSVAIEGASQGDAAAQDYIYALYFHKLARTALPKLSRLRGGLRDEYTVASSALRDYFMKAQAGKLPAIEDRLSLLSYLMVVVTSKALQQVRMYEAQKRQEDEVSESIVPSESGWQSIFDNLAKEEPSPEDVALFNEIFSQVKDVLLEREVRVLMMDLEGYSNQEIADAIPISNTGLKQLRRTALAKLAQKFDIALDQVREALRKDRSRHFD